VVIIGALTAVVAFSVDVAVATVADWKTGYCSTNMWQSRENCCREHADRLSLSEFHVFAGSGSAEPVCNEWNAWSDNYARSFTVYVALALVFGTISSSATMLTRSQLPSAETALTSRLMCAHRLRHPTQEQEKSCIWLLVVGKIIINLVLSIANSQTGYPRLRPS
jgi:H+/Cl- antiporter ClcA